MCAVSVNTNYNNITFTASSSPLKLLMEDNVIVSDLEEKVKIAKQEMRENTKDFDPRRHEILETSEVTIPTATPIPTAPPIPTATPIATATDDLIPPNPMIPTNMIEKATSGFTVLTEPKQEEEAPPSPPPAATWDPIGPENYFVFLS